MTVDKPPLALWVQALSVKVFGFHSLSILVPQALMGVGSVALVYDATRRHFGRVGGAVAGLVLATTPITVAISRHNNPDALLVLCCVAALWFVVRAFEDGRTRWIVLAGAAVGLGFEAKMAAAFMVVPAIAAAWLWVAPRGRARALGQLGLGGVALAAVGLAWPVLIWLTPAGSRPWVSGTADNSIWSLILDYNGFGRLAVRPAGRAAWPAVPAAAAVAAAASFGGDTGPLRLLNQALGGQAGWLLGFALVERRGDPRRDAPAAQRSAHGLADPGRRVVRHHGSRVQHGARASSIPTTCRSSRRSRRCSWAAGVAVMLRGGAAMRSSPRWRSPPG